MNKSAAFPAPSSSKSETEEGTVFAPKFDANGLVPVIAVSAVTGEVLMLAYMNADALARTIETGEAHYWSRSRGRLWRKGETSGNCQRVIEMRTDCDQDTLLLRIEMGGDVRGDDRRRGVLPHRAQILLLSRRARGRTDR